MNTQISQSQTDAITLDFTKWSHERRSAGLPADHDLWQRERDAVLSRQRMANVVARQDYLDNLEGLKRAKAQENDAKIDTTLAPRKEQLRRQWLVDHPESQPFDFDKKAWPHLRENLIAERDRLTSEQTMIAMSQTNHF